MNKRIAQNLSALLLTTCSLASCVILDGERSNNRDVIIDGLYFTLKVDTFEVTGKEEGFDYAPFTELQGELTRQQESAINSLCYFQFAGDNDGAKSCLSYGYLGAADLSDTRRVYLDKLDVSSRLSTLFLVANVGDVTDRVSPATTLDQLKRMSFDWTTTAATAGGQLFLPMTSQTTHDFSTVTPEAVTEISLSHRLARVNIYIDTSGLGSTQFLPEFVRLEQIATITSIETAANQPAKTPSTNFTTLNGSMTSFCRYIPENTWPLGDAQQSVLHIKGKLADYIGSPIDRSIRFSGTQGMVKGSYEYYMSVSLEPVSDARYECRIHSFDESSGYTDANGRFDALRYVGLTFGAEGDPDNTGVIDIPSETTVRLMRNATGKPTADMALDLGALPVYYNNHYAQLGTLPNYRVVDNTAGKEVVTFSSVGHDMVIYAFPAIKYEVCGGTWQPGYNPGTQMMKGAKVAVANAGPTALHAPNENTAKKFLGWTTVSGETNDGFVNIGSLVTDHTAAGNNWYHSNAEANTQNQFTLRSISPEPVTLYAIWGLNISNGTDWNTLSQYVLNHDEVQSGSTTLNTPFVANGYYRLTNSVTMTQPLFKQFSGTLDGQLNTLTLSNMTTVRTIESDVYSGIFGQLAGAHVCNLRLSGTLSPTITTAAKHTMSGVIAGKAMGGCIVENICSYADIKMITEYGTYQSCAGASGNTVSLGGLVGATEQATMRNCAVFSDITTNNSTSHAHDLSVCVGGVAGTSTNSSFSSCTVFGELTASAAQSMCSEKGQLGNALFFPFMGGVAGKMSGGSLNNCYAACSLIDARSANTAEGTVVCGIVGPNKRSTPPTATNCVGLTPLSNIQQSLTDPVNFGHVSTLWFYPVNNVNSIDATEILTDVLDYTDSGNNKGKRWWQTTANWSSNLWGGGQTNSPWVWYNTYQRRDGRRFGIPMLWFVNDFNRVNAWLDKL